MKMEGTNLAGESFVPGSFSDSRSYQLTQSGEDTQVHLSKDSPAVISLPDGGAVNPGFSEVMHSGYGSIQAGAEDLEASHSSHTNTHTLSESTVRVEINDFHGGSFNFTTSTLLKCKQKILRPYWRLLMFIGWRGFARESVNMGSLKWRIINVAYPVLICLVLLYTYIYEMVACQWKLNVREDTQQTSTTHAPTTTTHGHNESNETGVPFFTLSPALLEIQNISWIGQPRPSACEHLITTYIIPNFLHFVAYVMGMVYFRVQDNEQLYALMEKVFLLATPLHSRAASQRKMVNKIRCFLGLGAVWVMVTLVLQGLYVWAFDFPSLAFFETMDLFSYWLLFSLELLGRMVLNSVILAVVVNYATQCEVLLFFIRSITLRLQEKSMDLKTAMQDVLQLKQSLGWLNGMVSKMTSLVMVILAELTVIGISILCLTKTGTHTIWAYRSIFPFVWLLMLCFPLFQAARVNSLCKRLVKISLEIRVFGYKNSPMLDLDSFLNFVCHTRLKARLFHIPVETSYVVAALVVTSFTLLILFQTSIIGPSSFLF